MNTIKNKLRQEYEYNQENARMIKLKHDKEDYESCLSLTNYLKKNIKNATLKSSYLPDNYFTKCDEFNQLVKNYSNDANFKTEFYVNYLDISYDNKSDRVNINLKNINDDSYMY